jgi:hypothetical protein
VRGLRRERVGAAIVGRETEGRITRERGQRYRTKTTGAAHEHFSASQRSMDEAAAVHDRTRLKSLVLKK